MAREPAKKPDHQPGTVSSSQLAEVFDCTTRMIEKYAEAGIVVKVARGRYHFLQSVKGLVKHLRKQAASQQSADGKHDQISANVLAKQSQQRLTDIKIAQLEGTLISMSEVEESWSALVAANRQLVMSIPSRCRMELPHLDGQDQKVIDGLCRDLLMETALGEGRRPQIKTKVEA